MNRAALRLALLVLLFAGMGAATLGREDEDRPKRDEEAIRCVVIGGMTQSDFFQTVAARFEKQTGRPVRIAYSGPRHDIARQFVELDADLITMHASDTIINLVANGFAADPQPWARNDMLL